MLDGADLLAYLDIQVLAVIHGYLVAGLVGHLGEERLIIVPNPKNPINVQICHLLTFLARYLAALGARGLCTSLVRRTATRLVGHLDTPD